MDDEPRSVKDQRKKPVTLTADMLQLPHEIVLIIIGYLQPADLASLALACKDLYAIAGEGSILKFKDVPDQSDFLRRIEGHFPRHQLCYQCGKFHARRNVRNPLFMKSSCYKQAKPFKYLSDNWLLGKVSFFQVQAAMNRHWYGGGDLAKSLRRLRHECEFTEHDPKLQVKSHTEASIVENALILSISIRASVTGSASPVNQLMDSLGSFCGHHMGVRTYGPCRLNQKYCFTCSFCSSKLWIRFTEKASGANVTEAHGRVRYNLGDGRSPTNAQWLRLLGTSKDASLHVKECAE